MKMKYNIKVHFPQRKSIEAPVPNFTISYNDMTMTVNSEKLPTKLYKLLPVPLCNAKPNDWHPFCVLAVAMGLMK